MRTLLFVLAFLGLVTVAANNNTNQGWVADPKYILDQMPESKKDRVSCSLSKTN